MKTVIVYLFLFFVSFSAFSLNTDIDGLIFGNYSFYISDYKSNGTPANNYNTFDIGRIYLNANNNHSSGYYSKLTLEANTLSNGNNVFLKLAYLEKRSDNFNIKMGLIPSLWVGFEEGIWKNVFVEYTQMHYLKVINPSDKGVSLKYNLKNIKSSFETMISNGEGFKTIENSKTKDINLKFSFINSGFNLSSFFLSNLGNKEKQVISTLVGFESNNFSIASSFFKSISFSTYSIHSTGFSIYSNIDLISNYGIFVRWDRYDADIKKSDDIIDYYILGILNKINENIKVALSFKSIVPQKEKLSVKKENLIQSSFYVKF